MFGRMMIRRSLKQSKTVRNCFHLQLRLRFPQYKHHTECRSKSQRRIRFCIKENLVCRSRQMRFLFWCKHTIEVMLTNTKYLGESAVLKTTTAGYAKKFFLFQEQTPFLFLEREHAPSFVIVHGYFSTHRISTKSL